MKHKHNILVSITYNETTYQTSSLNETIVIAHLLGITGGELDTKQVAKILSAYQFTDCVDLIDLTEYVWWNWKEVKNNTIEEIIEGAQEWL